MKFSRAPLRKRAARRAPPAARRPLAYANRQGRARPPLACKLAPTSRPAARNGHLFSLAKPRHCDKLQPAGFNLAGRRAGACNRAPDKPADKSVPQIGRPLSRWSH